MKTKLKISILSFWMGSGVIEVKVLGAGMAMENTNMAGLEVVQATIQVPRRQAHMEINTGLTLAQSFIPPETELVQYSGHIVTLLISQVGMSLNTNTEYILRGMTVTSVSLLVKNLMRTLLWKNERCPQTTLWSVILTTKRCEGNATALSTH